MAFKECVRGLLSCAQAAKRQKTKLDFKTHELAFLVPHAKKNAFRVLGLFCLLILGSALSLPGPAIMGLIIDKIFIRKDAAKLNLYVGVLLAILLLSEIVKIFQEYCTIRLSQEFKFSIKSHLLERILKYPLSFFNDFQTGYVISRLDEVNLLGSFFSSTIPVLAENTLHFVGAIFLISRYDVKLTLVALPALPLFFEVSRRSVGMIRTTSLGTGEFALRE